MSKYTVEMSNSSIRPIDRISLGTTTLGQRGLGSDVNEGVLYIPQISSIIGALPSDCLMSHPVHLLDVLPFCRVAISIFYCPNGLGTSSLVKYTLIKFQVNRISNFPTVMC